MTGPGEGERPLYTIVAGPSGSGKSTLVFLLQKAGQLGARLNPDVIAASLPLGTIKRDQAAREVTVAETKRHFKARKSIARESAFSGKTIMNSIVEAKEAGFEVQVIFVAVRDIEEAIERVADRVKEGGHGIPEAEQRRRFDPTITNVATAARMVDSLVMFENPRDLNFRLVAEVQREQVTFIETERPAWVDAVVDGLRQSMPVESEQPKPVESGQERSDDLER